MRGLLSGGTTCQFEAVKDGLGAQGLGTTLSALESGLATISVRKDGTVRGLRRPLLIMLEIDDER